MTIARGVEQFDQAGSSPVFPRKVDAPMACPSGECKECSLALFYLNSELESVLATGHQKRDDVGRLQRFNHSTRMPVALLKERCIQDRVRNKATVSETGWRREIQRRYNEEHGITPKSIVKKISALRDSIWERDYVTVPAP